MDFPTIKEFKFSKKNVDHFYDFLELNYHFDCPYYLYVDCFSVGEVNHIIAELKRYAHDHQQYEYGPYPFYLVGDIVKEITFDWRYFVSELEDISDYYKRKIFLKDLKQMKELKTFQVYKTGIREQCGSKTVNRYNEINEICLSMKSEKIQHYKLNKILNSFKK